MEFDFAQNQTVPALEKVPQDFRGLYSAVEGGGFKLGSDNPAIASAVSAVTGLNNALKAARAEAKNKPAAVDLTPLAEYGNDPASVAAKFKETVEGLQGQIKGVNVEKIKTDLATEWNTKVTTAETRAKALESQLHQTLVVGAATGAIAAEKGEVELLLPFVQQQVKAGVDAKGNYIVSVVDQAGDIRYSGVTGAPMSVAELIKEMKANARFGKLFASEAGAGGGGASSAAAAAAKPATGAERQAANREGMSATDKIAAALRKNAKR